MRIKKLSHQFLLFCLLLCVAGCANIESSRDQLFEIMKIDPDSDSKPVGGISEWMTWYVAYDIEPPADSKKLIEQTIDIHNERDIDFIIWNCGRSTVAYQSDLAHTTRYCELGTMIGDKDWSFVARVLNDCCPLRHAVSYCHEKGIPILGRLAMNRHYGKKIHSGLTSRFATEHPEYWEVAKNGVPMKDKLCYAIEEVRQERLDILLEIQRKGVDALVLDYCRQMPILAYHDSLVVPYINKTGFDPREIESTNKEDYRDWFQYRSDVLTSFMEDLRNQVQEQEKMIGKPCPIIARIPDSAEWLLLAYGIDIERWMRDDLIDGTMLSPFPITEEDPELHTGYHVQLAHRFGKLCMGGVGSKNLKVSGEFANTGYYDPQPVYEFVHKQYQAGVDAMTIYQTDTLLRLTYLNDLLENISDPQQVSHLAKTLPEPSFPDHYPIGLDWHTKLPDFQHGLSVKEYRHRAL